jgi:hypothetical protein
VILCKPIWVGGRELRRGVPHNPIAIFDKPRSTPRARVNNADGRYWSRRMRSSYSKGDSAIGNAQLGNGGYRQVVLSRAVPKVNLSNGKKKSPRKLKAHGSLSEPNVQ